MPEGLVVRALEPSSRPYCVGWELLLAPMHGSAIACVDVGGDLAAELCSLCARLVCIALNADDEARLIERVQREGWQHAEVVHIDRVSAWLGSTGVRLDGVIWHDVMGWLQARLPGGAATLVEHLRPHLSEGAFVYLAGANRWRIPRAEPEVGGPPRRATNWLALRRALRRQGLQVDAPQALLLAEHGWVSDIVPARGYEVTKNHGLTVERIKTWVWGRWTARWFAHVVAVVGWVGRRGPTLLERIEAQLGRQFAPLGNWGQMLLLKGGKVIVSYPEAGTGAGCVVVTTRDPLAVARRQREGRVIDMLHERLPHAQAELIPRARDQFQVDGLECFVLDRIPGVTADALVPGMHEVNRNALAYLLGLHHASAACEPMDPDRWAARLGWMFDQAVQRNPDVATELRQIEAALRPRVAGLPWIEVIMHGDFKIENVMYDPHTRALTGVIDWEHAMLSGFPYIDLAYLMVYNRMLAGQSWFQAATDVMLSDEMSPEERALEDAYWREIGAGERLTPLLRALAPVHHIGCRRHGDWPGDEPARLRVLMRHCLQLIESVPLACADPVPAPFSAAIASAPPADQPLPSPAAAH